MSVFGKISKLGTAAISIVHRDPDTDLMEAYVTQRSRQPRLFANYPNWIGQVLVKALDPQTPNADHIRKILEKMKRYFDDIEKLSAEQRVNKERDIRENVVRLAATMGRVNVLKGQSEASKARTPADQKLIDRDEALTAIQGRLVALTTEVMREGNYQTSGIGQRLRVALGDNAGSATANVPANV